MLKRSHTAVVERNRVWSGVFETEPYEAGWAREAIVFVRVLEVSGTVGATVARVQISPDGMHWCDEGATVPISGVPGVTFGKVSHFGGYLRVVGEMPEGVEVKVVVYWALKE